MYAKPGLDKNSTYVHFTQFDRRYKMKLLAFIISLITSILVLTFYLLCEDLLLPVPTTIEVPDIIWGPKVGEDIKEFRISVPKKVLEDLKSRIELDLTRLSDPLEASNFEFGFNTNFLIAS